MRSGHLKQIAQLLYNNLTQEVWLSKLRVKIAPPTQLLEAHARQTGLLVSLLGLLASTGLRGATVRGASQKCSQRSTGS